ncbi:MAG: P-loop NTPase, partial [Paracoccaceae bacterium]
CGEASEIFGHGGVAKEAETLNLPLLATLPIDLETRRAGDAGRPVAAGTGPVAEAYEALAARLVQGGMA